jgi:hypothetical protein
VSFASVPSAEEVDERLVLADQRLRVVAAPGEAEVARDRQRFLRDAALRLECHGLREHPALLGTRLGGRHRGDPGAHRVMDLEVLLARGRADRGGDEPGRVGPAAADDGAAGADEGRDEQER